MTARTFDETAVLPVPDISCGHCEATIRSALAAVDGVDAVEPSAATKSVRVVFDPERVSLARIAAVLDEAGYPVAG